VEIDLKEDSEGPRLFQTVTSTDDFYLQLGVLAGDRLGTKSDTLIFLDEIQSYPHLLTMLKFLNREGRYTYIASGSQLGVALSQTASVPLGSISIEQMYPLDFEEFLLATGCGQDTIEGLRAKFQKNESLNESLHNYLLQQFKLYLLVGGLPEAVDQFVKTRNITRVRKIHSDIHALYRIDASQYDIARKLVIRSIYDMIPSNMENKKKRIVVSRIDNRAGHAQFSDYAEEFEYLTHSGIALAVQAVSNPKFPLIESETKNLLKLYLNDVGLLTNLFYNTNIQAVLQDVKSINLGSVYETVVAQELHAHGFALHYYDNKQKGEVDYLIDDYSLLSVVPLEIKSGKDYKVHSALDKFLHTPDYHICHGIVLSNERQVEVVNGITYLPIYYIMFFQPNKEEEVKVGIPQVPVID
jgi:predicted AAA+ superfamily ATPase